MTENPRATSGSTNAPSCAPRAPQPCTSRTFGPEPQRHSSMRRGPMRIGRARALASRSISAAGRRPRGGVRNSRSASRAATEGASRDSARLPARMRGRNRVGVFDRTIVLFSIAMYSASVMSVSPFRCQRRRPPDAAAGAVRAVGDDGTRDVHEGQADPLAIVRELLAVEVGAEVAFAHGDAGGAGHRVHPVAEVLNDEVAHGAGPIVELERRRHEWTATRE